MTLLDYWSSVTDRDSCLGRSCSAEEENAAAVENVFFAHTPLVYKVARRVLGNEIDAEDVTQDVMLRVLHKLHSFRGKGQFTAWLHRVTVNAALLHQRKSIHRRERQMDASLAVGRLRTSRPEAGPAQQLLDNEMRQLIEQAIAHLPEIYREVFVLAEIEERGNTEIGAILHISLPAVKSRLRRARLMMREALACYV